MGKRKFSRLMPLLVVLLLLVAAVGVAEIRSYTGVGTCTIGDIGTPEQAKNLAKEKALQNAREQAGVYIQSYTRTAKTKLASGELVAITNNITNVVGEVKYQQTPGMVNDQPVITYTATVTAKVDTDGIKKWLALDDKEKSNSVQQATTVQQVIHNSIEQLDKITQQYNESTTAQEKDRLKKEYDEADQGLIAAQKIDAGVKLYEAGNYDGAIKLYNEALSSGELSSTDTAIAYTNRGLAYGQKGKTDLAIADYDQALAVNPNYARAYYHRGTCYNDKGNHDRAIVDLDKAIELNPNKADYYNNRGIAYGDKGDSDRAIAEFTQAVTVDPNYATGFYNRGRAYDLLKGDKARAVTEYTKAIEVNPQSADAYNNRGSIYMDDYSEYDKAIADFNKCIDLRPNGSNGYYNRGNAYFHKGDYDRALKDWRKARKLEKDPARLADIDKNIEIAEHNKRVIEMNSGMSDLERSLSELSDALADLGSLF